MKKLLPFLFLVCLTSLLLGQVMTTNWQYSVNDGNLPSWFTVDSDDHRGFAYHDGSVYLGSWRSNGIAIIDVASGDSIGVVNESDLGIADVEISEDGVIFATNLAESGSPWVPAEVTLYMWTNADAARQTVFSFMPDTLETAFYRLGDKFTVVGDYNAGTLEIFMANGYWTGNEVYKFTMSEGAINPVPEVINVEVPEKLDRQAVVDPMGVGTDQWLISGNGQPIRYINSDGTVISAFSTGVVSDGNAFAHFETRDRKFVFQNIIWSGQKGQLIEWTDGVENCARHWDLDTPTLGPSGNNVNMTGDVDVHVNEDGTVDLFILMTDCGFASYHLEVPVAPVEPIKMANNWQVHSDELDFFLSSGDACRGMALNPATDHVLLASRAGRNGIFILDATDGSLLDSLDMTDVSDGLYSIALMKVVSTDDGVIYACNLAQGGDFTIYRLADVDAAPTVALQQNVSSRFGDVLEVYGTGTATKLYSSARGGTEIKVFGTADGINFSEESSVPITAGAANGDISVIDGDQMWINTAWGAVQKIDKSGTILAEASGPDSYYGNVQYMEGPYGEKLLAVSSNHQDGERRKVKLYDITENETNPTFWGVAETGNVERSNGNVAGDLAYCVNENGSIDLFQMNTNNAVASWNVTLPIYDNDIMITFADDSDIANWGAHSGASQWTTIAWSEEEKALKLNDSGWGFLADRQISATEGTDFRVSLSAKVTAWTHATNKLMATVIGLGTVCDTVELSDATEYEVFTITGTADTSSTGYLKIWGMNDGNATEAFINFILFDDYAIDAELAVAESALDFGEVALNGTETIMATAYNNGSENLVFESFVFNDGVYYEATASDEVVAPGDSTTIAVSFTPEIEDLVSDHLIVVTNGGIAGLSLQGSGYELWPLDWRITAGDPGSDWFWSASLQHYVRYLTYNAINNHIYVVSRIGGPHIYILDATSGELIGELDNSGIDQNEATFHINTAAVTEDGQIIVASLGRTPDFFNLYHYENELSAPQMVYHEDIGIVAGDVLSVVGTGNNLTVMTAGHWPSDGVTGGSLDLTDKVAILETTDLISWSKEIIDIPEKRDANYGVSATADAQYLFINGTGLSSPMYLKRDGTILHEFDPAVVPSGTSIHYFEVETAAKGVRRFVSITNGWSSGTAVVELLGEPGDSLCSEFNLIGTSTEDYAVNSNANATAMSAYDYFNNSIVELVTNNGISSYSFDVVVPDYVAPDIPVLSMVSRTIDLGSIVRSIKTANVTITNAGTMELVIDSVQVSAAELTIDLVSDTLAAGASVTYQIALDGTELDGTIEENIRLYTNIGLDQISVTATCISVEGNAINENFRDWSQYDGHGWSGDNVTLRADGYGHNDSKYIGPSDSNLDKAVTILTPKVVNPTKLLFYYAEFSGSSDSWTLYVVLSEDGETWSDTLGIHTNPNTLDWQQSAYTIEKEGAYHIGFIISDPVAGGMFIDDVKVDGDGVAIEGTALAETFESWNEYSPDWGGSNVTLWNDQYAHQGTHYLGPENISQPITIITPLVSNPNYLNFYMAQYNLSDSWTLKVMLSEDGITYADTLGMIDNPGNFDWQFVSLAVPQQGDYYICFVVDGTVNGGLFIDDVRIDGDELITGITDSKIPLEFKLSQNYPNPFNPTTNIRLSLPEAGDVQLMVYNLIGQQVASIHNGPLQAGYHLFHFDASRLASGIYFYKVTAGTHTDLKKMTILK